MKTHKPFISLGLSITSLFLFLIHFFLTSIIQIFEMYLFVLGIFFALMGVVFVKVNIKTNNKNKILFVSKIIGWTVISLYLIMTLISSYLLFQLSDTPTRTGLDIGRAMDYPTDVNFKILDFYVSDVSDGVLTAEKDYFLITFETLEKNKNINFDDLLIRLTTQEIYVGIDGDGYFHSPKSRFYDYSSSSNKEKYSFFIGYLGDISMWDFLTRFNEEIRGGDLFKIKLLAMKNITLDEINTLQLEIGRRGHTSNMFKYNILNSINDTKSYLMPSDQKIFVDRIENGLIYIENKGNLNVLINYLNVESDSGYSCTSKAFVIKPNLNNYTCISSGTYIFGEDVTVFMKERYNLLSFKTISQ
ncbi:MAG: hypothetical protein HRU03_05870 [Nanoarchaeales archaeon]|nr:hypothetical protein [Nanoarchaeales archaeon]